MVGEPNRVSFFVCEEAWYVTVEAFAEKPAKEVNAELVDKILETRLVTKYHEERC